MTTLAQPPIVLPRPHSFHVHSSELSIPEDMEQADEQAEDLHHANSSTPTSPSQSELLTHPPPPRTQTNQTQPTRSHIVQDFDMDGGEDTAGVSPSPWDGLGLDAIPHSVTPHDHLVVDHTIPAADIARTSPHEPSPPAFTVAHISPLADQDIVVPSEQPNDSLAHVPTSQDIDRRHRGEDESAEEDEDDDDEENDDHIMHFYPFQEDTVPPSEEEMRIINASNEHSALDDQHWRAQTFFNMRDPEILPGESGVIEWTVESFNGTKENPRKDLLVRSPIVRIGNHDWRIKLIPRGQIHTDRVSVYVECASVVAPTPEEWSEEQLPLPTIGNTKLLKRHAVTAQISVLMYNPEEPRVHEFRAGKHQFQSSSPDHGWPRFTNAAWHEINRRSYMSRRPLLQNDRLALKAYIRVVHDPTGCMWMHDDLTMAPESVATTGLQNLPAFDDLAVGPVVALWLHLRPFRHILYRLGAHDLLSGSTANTSNPLAMLQAILYRMRSRVEESSDSRSRTQIHEFVDYVYDTAQDSYDVMQTMNLLWSEIEEQLHKLTAGDDATASAARLASEELRSLLGSRELHFSGLRKTKLSIVDKKCMQEVVNAAEEELRHLESPQLLTLELARQVFDEKKRCWKKLRNKVRLEDEINVNGATYTLYGFAAHAGYLQHGRYTSFFRPNGLGNLWYTYRSGRPECLTIASALASNEGNTKSRDLEEPFLSHERHAEYSGFGSAFAETESYAYVVLYLRNDIASDSFYMSSTEPWEVPMWILDGHRPSTPADSTSDLQDTLKPNSLSATMDPVTSDHVSLNENGMLPPGLGVQDEDTEMDDTMMTASTYDMEASIVKTTSKESKTPILHKKIDYFSQPFYEGQVKDDDYHGDGHLIYLNGDEYVGTFQHGHRHGEGKMVYQNGDIYEGTWHENKHEGQGVYTEKRTGNVYKGTFKEGKKYGEGTTFWKVSDEQSRLCQICYYHEANVAFYDCGHVVACAGCARRVEDCPVCRRKIAAVLKLYYMA